MGDHGIFDPLIRTQDDPVEGANPRASPGVPVFRAVPAARVSQAAQVSPPAEARRGAPASRPVARLRDARPQRGPRPASRCLAANLRASRPVRRDGVASAGAPAPKSASNPSLAIPRFVHEIVDSMRRSSSGSIRGSRVIWLRSAARRAARRLRRLLPRSVPVSRSVRLRNILESLHQ